MTHYVRKQEKKVFLRGTTEKREGRVRKRDCFSVHTANSAKPGVPEVPARVSNEGFKFTSSLYQLSLQGPVGNLKSIFSGNVGFYT